MKCSIKISEICKKLHLEYIGDDMFIDGLNLCNRRSEHNNVLSYATNPLYIEVVMTNNAVKCLVIEREKLLIYQRKLPNMTYIVCEKPEEVFYDIHDYLFYQTKFYEKYDFKSKIGHRCKIASSAIIENGVIIGDEVIIGDDTVIKCGTVIEKGCSIGCNNTIGNEGFQIIKRNGVNCRIVHAGGAYLDEGVHVANNTCIDKALFEGATKIGKNTMIDSQCYVGHNVVIEEGVVVTAGCVLCGSSYIESDVWIGVNASILNRVRIGQGTKIGMGSVVTKEMPQNVVAYGNPARVHRHLGEI